MACRNAKGGRLCRRARTPNGNPIAKLARTMAKCEGKRREEMRREEKTPATGRAGAAPLMVTLQGGRGIVVAREVVMMKDLGLTLKR